MKNQTALNDLIGSRICHDLISPLGAIENGVELLTMSGAAEVPEMALISESILNANARIRFFRIAFGAGMEEAKIGRSEVKSILMDMYRGSRNRIDWQPGEDQSRIEVKLAFLLLLCLESALPWGGTITVRKTGAANWTMIAEGERLKMDEELWGMISAPHSETKVSASEVHFALVQTTASRFGRKVTALGSERKITVSF